MFDDGLSDSDLIAQIRALESASRSLEPSADERHRALSRVAEYTDDFLDSIHQQPGYRVTADMGAALERFPIGNGGHDLDVLLRLLKENVDVPGSNPAAPGHLAYIPACSNYYSALGDYLAAVSNRFSGNFFAGPGAVRMENLVLSWMARLVGYSDQAAGNLASGGSLANLTAIVTAREAFELKSRHYSEAVVYVTEHTHHSIDKALHIVGLGECVKRRVAVDAQGRMVPEDAAVAIERDGARGLRPWLLIASAGTTNLGSIDPLADAADIARQHGLWLHTDAAYGGFFMLSDLVRDRLTGIEQSDSVILDPHKSLYIPFGTGALLVRNGILLRNAHRGTADYLQDQLGHADERNPQDLGPELTRPFRALRIWLPLMLLGTAPFRAALDEKVLLARYAYNRLQALDRIELGAFPELSIFVFRFLPAQGDADAFNERLLESLRQDGRIFLSSTRVNGKYMIRFPLLSFRTHLGTVDLAVELIRQHATALLPRGL